MDKKTEKTKAAIPTNVFIRNCAIELFQEYGYEQVSVEQICAKAGITRSAFYYYYKTKSQVMGALFSDMLSEGLDALEDKLKRQDPWDFLWGFVCLYADRCVELGKNVLSSFMAISLQERLETFLPIDELFSLISAVVTKGQATGRFKNTFARKFVVAGVRSLMIGLSYDWCNSRVRGDFDFKKALELELRALLMVA